MIQTNFITTFFFSPHQLASDNALRRVNVEEDDRLLLAHLDLKERHYREYAEALQEFGVGDDRLRDETFQEAEALETLKARMMEEEKIREEEEERMRREFEERRRLELERELTDLEVRSLELFESKSLFLDASSHL